jgi:hypothetical protein
VAASGTTCDQVGASIDSSAEAIAVGGAAGATTEASKVAGTAHGYDRLYYNGQYLCTQGDGNLVMCGRWAAYTNPNGYRAEMQDDCDLVVYDRNDHLL